LLPEGECKSGHVIWGLVNRPPNQVESIFDIRQNITVSRPTIPQLSQERNRLGERLVSGYTRIAIRDLDKPCIHFSVMDVDHERFLSIQSIPRFEAKSRQGIGLTPAYNQVC